MPCQKCANCCVQFDLRVERTEIDDPLRQEFFVAKGIRFYEGEDGYVYAHIHQPCPHLMIEGHGVEGTWACRIYPDRPEICKNFDCGGSRHVW